jgi:hypothetical protein
MLEPETAGRPVRSQNNYTRVNGDLIQTYMENDRRTLALWRSRDGALGELVFKRPADKSDDWSLYDNVIASSFSVSDTLKAP